MKKEQTQPFGNIHCLKRRLDNRIAALLLMASLVFGSGALMAQEEVPREGEVRVQLRELWNQVEEQKSQGNHERAENLTRKARALEDRLQERQKDRERRERDIAREREERERMENREREERENRDREVREMERRERMERRPEDRERVERERVVIRERDERRPAPQLRDPERRPRGPEAREAVIHRLNRLEMQLEAMKILMQTVQDEVRMLREEMHPRP